MITCWALWVLLANHWTWVWSWDPWITWLPFHLNIISSCKRLSPWRDARWGKSLLPTLIAPLNLSSLTCTETVPTWCRNHWFLVYCPIQVSKFPKSRNSTCLAHHGSLAMSTEGIHFIKIQYNPIPPLHKWFKRVVLAKELQFPWFPLHYTHSFTKCQALTAYSLLRTQLDWYLLHHHHGGIINRRVTPIPHLLGEEEEAQICMRAPLLELMTSTSICNTL